MMSQALGWDKVFKVRHKRMWYWIKRVRRHHQTSIGWGWLNTAQAFVLGMEKTGRGVSAEHHMKGLWRIGAS